MFYNDPCISRTASISYELERCDNQNAQFKSERFITAKTRILELVIAILFSLPIVTLAFRNVRNHWISFWTGCKREIYIINMKQIHPHRWALINKIEGLRQQQLRGKTWNELLTLTPEAFEFAPLTVKKDPISTLAALKGNAFMANHLDETLRSESTFLLKATQINWRVMNLLQRPLRPANSDSLPLEFLSRNFETGIFPEDMQTLADFIDEYKAVWLKHLSTSEESFIYLKSRFLQIPYAIQAFKNGDIFIHTHCLVGKGSLKKAQAVVNWNTQEKYVKISLKHRLFSCPLKDEYEIHQKFDGKRGFVPLIGCYSLPSKKNAEKLKTVLILKRYTNSLYYLNKWDAQDLTIISLDLLYALKATREADLHIGDFHDGNVVVLCDENERALKAGLIDFEVTAALSEHIRKARNPQQAEFELQNEIINMLKLLYYKNGISSPFSGYRTEELIPLLEQQLHPTELNNRYLDQFKAPGPMLSK